MYSAFRPAARRLLLARPNINPSTPSSLRAITTQSIAFSNRSVPAAASLRVQRRWNSDEASKKVPDTQAKTKSSETAIEDKAEAEAEAFLASGAVPSYSKDVKDDVAASTILENALNSVAKDAPASSNTATSADEFITSSSSPSSSVDPLAAEGKELREGLQFNDPHGGKANTTPDANLEESKPNRMLRLDGSNVTPKETIYVGNLFFDVTAGDLKARMQSFGVVTSCTIVHDSRGLSKGFGYVTFENVESAQRAIAEMHQQIYEGRRIIVQYSAASALPLRRDRRQRNPTRTLYIGNLAYDLTDRELNDLFKSVRNVIEVRVAVDRQTGQPRGFAHADFIDVASAQAAAEILASKAPHGRRLRIDFSQRVQQRPVTAAPAETTEQTPESHNQSGNN